jgi:RNA polymerase sigma factor (sigma-70 family)
MGFYRIVSAKAESEFHFEQFVKGEEASLAYIYMKLYKKIRRYGLRIVQDDFVVNTIIQDAFLKVWGFRERMTSMNHVERFLKLTVRWECMHYYRNRLETLYRKALRINWLETWEIPEQMVTDDIDTTENRLHRVRALIPKLPGERQRVIMTFYAKDGMSIQQIARRLHGSPQAIATELRQALAGLCALVEPGRKTASSARQVVKTEIRPIPGMSNEAAHIVTLRRDMKYSFGQIADLLKLPQPYVQKQYVEACKILSSKKVWAA